MSSQIWNQNKTPLANRYIDALHQSTSPRSNIMETNSICTIETKGRRRNSLTPVRRNDTPQDSIGRSNSPGGKKPGTRPTPEELVHTQVQGSQRFPSARSSTTTTTSNFSFCSPRDASDTGTTGFTSANVFPKHIPQRVPLRLRDSLVPASTSTFQVIPPVTSIDTTDLNWEDDFSSSSYAENSPKEDAISSADTPTFCSPVQNPGARRKINEYGGAQQDGSEETIVIENEADNSTPFGSNLKSVKDRIKSFQKCKTIIKEPSSIVSATPDVNNDEQDQNENEDKENGQNWNNSSIKLTSTTTFGAISQGSNGNILRNVSGGRSLVSPSSASASNPNSPLKKALKKAGVTASFLVAVNKYSSQPQQEKVETQPSQKGSKPTLQVITNSVEIGDETPPNMCLTPNRQISSGECSSPIGGMPTPGTSSTLIASWRQREASNVSSFLPKTHSSSKKVPSLTLPSVPVLQSRYVECDTNSIAESIESSLTGPPMNKSIRRTSTQSLKDDKMDIFSSLSTFIDLQVETRLSHLEAQMERDLKDKLDKIEAKLESRMNTKIEKMINMLSVQK